MKRRLLTFLLIFTCNIAFSAAIRIDPGHDSNAARKNARGIDATTWQAAMDVYSKGAVEGLIAQTSGMIRFYVNPEASGIDGFAKLEEFPLAVATEATTPALATSTLTYTRGSISAEGHPGITRLEAGAYLGSFVCKRTGAVDAQVQFKLYKCDSSGNNEVLIGESAIYTITNTDKQTVQVAVMAIDGMDLLATDRIILKTYCARVGGTGTPTITFYYGEENQTIFSITAPGGTIYARMDSSNVSATDTWRSTLDVYSKQETDNLTAGNSLLYYLAETGGAFANYESLQNAPVIALASDSAVTVGATQVLGDQWITATGSPDLTVIRDGIYVLHHHVTKGTGSDMSLTYELGYVSAEGVWTFVASSASELLTADSTEVSLDVNITVYAPVTIIATDFLAIRQYAIRSGTVNTSLVNWYGSTKQAFFNVPIVGGYFMRVDGSNSTANVARKNMDVYSKGELATVSLPLTGGTLNGNLLMSDGALVELATGTATNLALRFRTDTNTGIFSSAVDTIDFYTNGNSRMALTNTALTVYTSALYTDGNVSARSAGKFYINASVASSTYPIYAFHSDVDTGIGRYEAGKPSMVADGVEVQRWSNIGTTHYQAISHIVADGGYTTYQGNTVYSATGEDYVTLPINLAATSIAFDAETSGYIRAEIVGTNSTDTACIHVTLSAAFEDFGDTLAFVGSPASLTDQLNAATWSASLSASGDDLSVIATGAVGTIWQVKKLEIGGL